MAGVERGWLTALSATPWRMAASLLVAGLVLRGALLPLLPPAVAIIPDDFSLLLQAQTFLAGRLANPAHPLGAFFDTKYVNQLPAYASIYFPGRSLPLIIGILISGHPWAGVWLTMLALALATAWMLRAWVAPPLALLGGLIVILRLGVFSFWINSYLGGTLTALGGVLVIGAFERLRGHVTLGHSLILAAGVLILMLTRPFEGFLFCLPFAAAVAWRLFAVAAAAQPWRMRAILVVPALLALAAGGTLLAAHNRATTGSVLLTPYEVNRRDYATVPAFLTGRPQVPQRAVPAYLGDYFVREGEPYQRLGEPFGIVRIAYAKLLTVLLFCVGPALLVPFVIGLGQWRRFRVPAAAAGAVVSGYMLTTWDWAHYLGPALGVFILVIMLGFERLPGWRWRGRAVGTALARALPLVLVAMLAVPVVALATDRPVAFTLKRSCCITRTTSDRAAAERRLLAIPGRHLVLVGHDAEKPVLATWIANAPDIDAARIIWANDLGHDRNAALLSRYPDRRLWVVRLRAGETPQLVEVARAGPAS